jgi:membrane-associated phospholipid phosphatase
MAGSTGVTMLNKMTGRSLRRISVIMACTCTTLIAPVARAQTPLATADSAKRVARPLFTMNDAIIGGGFAAATVLLFPVDRNLAGGLQNEGTQANKFFRHASSGVEVIASPGAYVIGGSMLVVGRLTGSSRIADLGWHGTESVLLAEAFTYVLKGAVGRARPFVSGAKDPNDFEFGGGWSSGGQRRSFPSGHTSTAFAAAASVTAEVSEWWPQHDWLIGLTMYGGATMVGLSRMYHNRHWASDVALGAAIGTFSGWKVVQYTHDHPDNWPDRIMTGTTILPHKGGFTLAWTSAPGRRR